MVMKQNVAVVIPNWNGKDFIRACLDSLFTQTLAPHIIVVDNGSVDGSPELIEEHYPDVELIRLPKNIGFAAGVNVGINSAIKQGLKFVALFNDDAEADKDWLKHLVGCLEDNENVGIATGKFVNLSGEKLDSTGDLYTTWGLPYPRGRNELVSDKYDQETLIFGASGGASLYRISMLKQIGLFDEDFFAYYEDVDLSFRAQLAGWRVKYVPGSIARHHIGATSGKIKGFTTYQTMKNLPWLYWKNVPKGLRWKILVRFKLAYFSIFFSSIAKGKGWPATKGMLKMLLLLPKKFVQRHKIQKNRTVSAEYIASILTWDLPPNATKLKKVRKFLRRLFLVHHTS